MFKKMTITGSWVVFFILSLFLLNAYGAVETIQYVYDDMDQISSVEYDNGQSDQYIYDAMGNRKTRTVSGDTINSDPEVPHSPTPAENATDISPVSTLEWSGQDPDPDNQVTYSVYLGTDQNPPLFASGLSQASLSIDSLAPNTTYYWAVLSTDNHGASTKSNEWSFSTGNQSPELPTSPQPTDNHQISYGNVYLRWSCSDPDVTDSLAFDVYFGTSQTPELVASDHGSSAYDI